MSIISNFLLFNNAVSAGEEVLDLVYAFEKLMSFFNLKSPLQNFDMKGFSFELLTPAELYNLVMWIILLNSLEFRLHLKIREVA